MWKIMEIDLDYNLEWTEAIGIGDLDKYIVDHYSGLSCRKVKLTDSERMYIFEGNFRLYAVMD